VWWAWLNNCGMTLCGDDTNCFVIHSWKGYLQCYFAWTILAIGNLLILSQLLFYKRYHNYKWSYMVRIVGVLRIHNAYLGWFDNTGPNCWWETCILRLPWRNNRLFLDQFIKVLYFYQICQSCNSLADLITHKIEKAFFWDCAIRLISSVVNFGPSWLFCKW
jgi:hypothetical protein